MIIIQGNKAKYWLGILASIFLGMVFLVAGSGKVLAPVVESELPQLLLVALVVIELAIGAFLVAGVFAKMAVILSLPVIASFVIGNILMKMLGRAECLSCFGAMGKLSTTQALYFDGVMVVLAVMILMWYPARFSQVRPWYWGK